MKTGLVKLKGEIFPNEISMGLTSEELKMIKNTMDNINEVIFMKYLDFYHYYPEHFINMLFSIKSGHRIPFRTVQAWEYLERSAVFPLCILQIEEVGYLSSSDRRILLHQSYPKYFGMAWYSLGKKDPNSFIINLRNRKDVSEAQLNTFTSILEELSIFTENESLSVVQYEAIYASPWASSWEIEENHKKLQNRILHLSRNDPNYPRDPILYTLLILMLLFFTDGVEFEDPNMVEKLHLKYSQMLYRYLRSNMTQEKAQLKYAQCLLLSKDTRQIYELHSKMLPT
uniref:Vitamin D3 receptorlike [Metaseiulus occidentalis] n=2 Tax=Lepeophtheirus salmonis TaxID=72036 RepID=A0A0K2VD04_LEPSM